LIQKYIFLSNFGLMKIADNKIKTLAGFINKELKDIYPEHEIRNIIHLAFEHCLGFSKAEMLAKQEDELSQQELEKFYSIIEELKSNKPIQYVLGETKFYGLRLKVNKHVMIPRPETEELVDWIIGNVNVESQHKINVIDLCTGSGCIAIALKKNIPVANVFATDISTEALELAEQNAAVNNTEIDFIQTDVLGSDTTVLPDNVNLIVSNPPYVLQSEKKQMQKNVLDYEPHTALFVNDDDPLLFYKAIVKFASKHLKTSGWLFFEISEYLGKEIEHLLVVAGFSNITLKKDINGKPRMISAQMR